MTPLHQLTKKGEAWRWTEDEQEAIKELKQLITLTPILVQPNQNVHFWLEMDMSRYTISQFCEDDKWHLIGFMSKSLLDTERNYKIHDKEILSVIQGLE